MSGADAEDNQPHILMVGRTDGVLPQLWSLSPTATTSLLTHLSSLVRERGLGEHHRVVGLADDAPGEQWIEMARAIGKERPLTRVVGFDDRSIPHAQAISAALGLPGHLAETVRNVYNKAAFRRCLRDAGVQDVPHVIAQTPADVIEFGDRVGWPVIAKPTRGSGSYGVTMVLGADEAAAAFRHAAAQRSYGKGGVLVEARLIGRQFALEVFSEDGEHQAVAVNDYFTEPPHMVISGFALPHTASPEVESAIVDHTYAALRALRVKNGPTHVEAMMTADGPRLIEAHLRTGGDDLPILVQQVTGIDIERVWARQILGERVLPRLRARLAQRPRNRATAVAFATPATLGVLRGLDGVADAMAVPGVVEVRELLQAGDRVRSLTGFDRRVAVVKADHEESTQALTAARAGAQRLRFDVVANAADAPVGREPPMSQDAPVQHVSYQSAV